jgi:large subunit ribosomal protein L23
MLNTSPVIRKPRVTEKSQTLRESNRYVIEVEKTASKSQIKQAVEARFKVNVVKINTTKILGKYRRKVGPMGGFQPDRKKAIIEVKAGQKITWDEAK